jgi:hypothetical protein
VVAVLNASVTLRIMIRDSRLRRNNEDIIMSNEYCLFLCFLAYFFLSVFFIDGTCSFYD